MKRIIYLIFFLIMSLGCKEVYEVPPQSLLQVSVLESGSGDILSPKISILGIGLDSLWVYDTELSSFLLPLSPEDQTKFLISFDSYIDTLTFFHETTLKYASMETGFHYDFKLDSLYFTRNRIDSIQITDSLITTTWNENIKLYIRPLPSGSN